MHKLNYEITKDTKMDWIMYLVGGLDRSVVISVDTGPSIGRYIGRVSTDTVSGISVNFRLHIGRLSVLGRYSIDYRSMLNQYLVSLDVQ